VSAAHRVLAGITVPQQLLIASAVTYGVVFGLLLEYGRPGLGMGEGFFVAVILAAAATSPALGALAGLGALFLYELAIHEQTGSPGATSTMRRRWSALRHTSLPAS
jgi:hypothetical protein